MTGKGKKKKTVKKKNSTVKKKKITKKGLTRDKDPSNPLNTIRKKIEHEGKPYRCTKATLNKKKNKVVRNYSCQMIKGRNVGATWIVGAANRIPTDAAYDTCKGSLKGYFKRNESWFEILNSHTCFVDCNPKTHSDLTDWRTPFAMIGMNPNFKITRERLTDIKRRLQDLTDTHWTALKYCGRDRMYLPGLETTSSLTEIRDSIRNLIQPIVSHYIARQCPKLTHYKVGAIKSKGEESQYEKWDNHYHRDFDNDIMQTREPNEQPYSLIVALDPFNFKFEEQSCVGHIIDREVLVDSGHAVVFTNALKHAGGANLVPQVDIQDPYVYRLFAYVVSNPVDYPPGEGGTIEPVLEKKAGNVKTKNEDARDTITPLIKKKS